MADSKSNSPSRSGAFQQQANPLAEAFTQSIDLDRRLYRHDIAASIAHAQMLASIELISNEEFSQIQNGLQQIQNEIESDQFEFSSALEDIHMHIESALINKIGDAGRKLHTARSRNDQVASSMRLWLRDEIDQIDELIGNLQIAFVERCQQDHAALLPAYTHLQRAQPVLASHYWLAYCEKLQRDRDRLADCRKRVNQNPLGCGAVAGSSIGINRQMTTQALGFEGLTGNSIDTSGDRDFLVETVFCWSLLGLHLSGWAEEWIIWASDEFRMIELPQDFCTGSSMMPQKINPDCLELIRGKSSVPYGALSALLMLVKGLPNAYNRDLQEDKRQLFAAADSIRACLAIAEPIVRGMKVKTDTIHSRLQSGFLDATSLMEYLIKQGHPMRSAHHLVGEIVRFASENGKSLEQLNLEEFQSFDPELDQSVYDVIGVDQAVAAFCSEGSTGPERVAEQTAAWRSRLGLA